MSSITASVSDSSCLDTSTVASRAFQAVLFLHIICSIIALVANALFIKKVFSKLYFHNNIKILIMTAIIMNCIHSFIYLCLQSTHLYYFLTVNNECDIILYQSVCFMFRYPSTIAMFSFIVLNGSIVIERLLATIYIEKYTKKKEIYGKIICIISVIISIILPLTSLTLTPWTETTTYCNAVTKYSASAISFTSYCMLAFDGIVLILYYLVNSLNEKYRKCTTYDLKKTYQIRENCIIFQLLMPWMIFNFLIFAFFYISNAIIPLIQVITSDKLLQRTIFAIVYVVPEYCALSPLLLWKIYLNQKVERLRNVQTLTNQCVNADAYFRGYTWTSNTIYTFLKH